MTYDHSSGIAKAWVNGEATAVVRKFQKTLFYNTRLTVNKKASKLAKYSAGRNPKAKQIFGSTFSEIIFYAILGILVFVAFVSVKLCLLHLLPLLLLLLSFSLLVFVSFKLNTMFEWQL